MSNNIFSDIYIYMNLEFMYNIYYLTSLLIKSKTEQTVTIPLKLQIPRKRWPGAKFELAQSSTEACRPYKLQQICMNLYSKQIRGQLQQVFQALKLQRNPETSLVFQAVLQNWVVLAQPNLLPQPGPKRSQVCVAPAYIAWHHTYQ